MGAMVRDGAGKPFRLPAATSKMHMYTHTHHAQGNDSLSPAQIDINDGGYGRSKTTKLAYGKCAITGTPPDNQSSSPKDVITRIWEKSR
ncbi:hypothetical protein RB195_008452 [Necator americanus]|uniref:Uncharacterized protein n=1 Tax=Necator americanus TaxID=51031 RepID=A0ABR1CQL6_NECAM